jgi:YrbI family 3-deoxy-D-manno-octulosonate 8-phosphate phosphatase
MDKIKYLITDCDGVLTDGKYYYGTDGKTFITFNAKDSLAIKLLKQDGIIPIVISSTSYTDIVRCRTKELGIDFYSVPPFQKLSFVSSRFNLDSIIYIGDSLDDIDLLKSAKLSFTPSDTSSSVKSSVNTVLDSAGGTGCILEIYLRINNKWER